MPSQQRLLRGPGPLLLPDGSLADIGWARQPVLDCNLEQARTTLPFLQWARVKRWDYYGVTTPSHFYSFTLANLGYAASIFAYVVDFASGEYHEQTLTIPLARGLQLARNSTSGFSAFKNNTASLCFETLPEARKISVWWKNFAGHDLRAELLFDLPDDHDSLVIVIPINGKRFYYNRKVNCMPVSGWVEFRGERTLIDPTTCLGGLDWGRGVWEYNSRWVWASASAFLPDRRTLGLNLGYGFGDLSAATENAIIIDGKLHKLGQVDFTLDPHDYCKPWQIHSPDGRMDVQFAPFLERVARTDLKLITSNLHQMFGLYSGVLVLDSGERLEIRDLLGFAEVHHARW